MTPITHVLPVLQRHKVIQEDDDPPPKVRLLCSEHLDSQLDKEIILDYVILEREKRSRDKLISHYIQPLLEGIVQKLIQILQEDKDLYQELKADLKKEKTITFVLVMNTLLEKLLKYSPPDNETLRLAEDEGFVWVNPYSGKIAEILSDFDTLMSHIEKHNPTDNPHSVMTLLNTAIPGAPPSPSKWDYAAKSALVSGKVLLFVFSHSLKLLSLSGIFLNTPWASLLQLLIKFALK